MEQAGHGLSVMFAPGGRHAVVGTKEGAIDILDVGAATLVETLPAHTSAVSRTWLPSAGFEKVPTSYSDILWMWASPRR